MKGFRRHPFRLVIRLIGFLIFIVGAFLDYFFRCAFRADNSRRAVWLQRHSRRLLRLLKFEAKVSGEIPQTGLLISNHLSYLDILVLSSLTPAVFVSKREVRDWPLIGRLASLGGTIFIDRERRTHVGAVNDEIQSALNQGALVVIFPEGTSSNGETILPFRSSLLEPAVGDSHALSVSWLHYEITDGDAREEVCYWGDHTFFPHLLNLFSKSSIRSEVRFASILDKSGDRKELARQLHAEVVRLKASGASSEKLATAG